MSDDGSITISARGAFITGLISILLSPFALVLGYYVNRIVGGPKTTVVDASAVPIHQIDAKVVALFYKDAAVFGTFSNAHLDDADSGKTGDTVFYVVMLNTGDGDDILYPNAELKFDDGTLNLKSGEYATVKSHSFQQTRYEIDRGTTPDNNLKAWGQFVRRNAGTQFTITIHLGGNRSSSSTNRVQG